MLSLGAFRETTATYAIAELNFKRSTYARFRIAAAVRAILVAISSIDVPASTSNLSASSSCTVHRLDRASSRSDLSAQYKLIDTCAFITRSRLRRSQTPVLFRQNLKAWNLAFPVAFCLTASGLVRGEICTIAQLANGDSNGNSDCNGSHRRHPASLRRR
jgi:hypothetical protein